MSNQAKYSARKQAIDLQRRDLATRQGSPSVNRNSPTSFSVVLTTATENADQAGTGSAAPTDFTSMTRKGLFERMNSKIKSGEMSLADSSAFLGMTVKIPVGAGQSAPVALDDRDRVNFVQMAQDGIVGAQSRNDSTTLKMLQNAMQLMQNDHGANIDRRA